MPQAKRRCSLDSGGGEGGGYLLLRRYTRLYGEVRSGALPCDHVTTNMATALAQSREGRGLGRGRLRLRFKGDWLAVTDSLSWRRTGWGEFSAPCSARPARPLTCSGGICPYPRFRWRVPSPNPGAGDPEDPPTLDSRGRPRVRLAGLRPQTFVGDAPRTF